MCNGRRGFIPRLLKSWRLVTLQWMYFVRRLAYLIVVVLGASTIIFLLVRVIPGDPMMVLAGDYAGPEEMERLREKFGLDLPIYEQYFLWLGDLLRGEFGRSFRNSELIITEIVARVPATIELALTSLILGSSVGLVLGVVAAINRQTWIDKFVMFISLIGIAVPVFWIGLMFIMLFSVELGLLPLGGRIAATTDLSGPTGIIILDGILIGDLGLSWEALKHLILPAITLSSYPLATVARVTRSSMLDVLKQDYIKAARAKGLSLRSVIIRHALRNALIPIITVIGLSIGPLVGGAVLTENVFGWPGLGRYVVLVINSRDFPAIQAMVFIAAFGFAAVNLLVDFAYSFIDPRIRY